MPVIIEPESTRLKLRQWQKTDKPDFARLNADVEVMQYFTDVLSVEQSNVLADRIHGLIEQQGWGLWAVEELAGHRFIGFVGLHRPKAEIPCSPCFEIGWRLAKAYWGQGYATEAARLSLEVAFNQLACRELYAFTAVSNIKSQKLMQRLGMQNTDENFQHPDIPAGHPLREQLLYKITQKYWRQHVGPSAF